MANISRSDSRNGGSFSARAATSRFCEPAVAPRPPALSITGAHIKDLILKLASNCSSVRSSVASVCSSVVSDRSGPAAMFWSPNSMGARIGVFPFLPCSPGSAFLLACAISCSTNGPRLAAAPTDDSRPRPLPAGDFRSPAAVFRSLPVSFRR